MWVAWVLLCGGLTTVGHLVVVIGPNLVVCQALPCVEAAGHWLVGPSHDAAGCGTLAGPRANAGSLVGQSWVRRWMIAEPSLPRSSVGMLFCLGFGVGSVAAPDMASYGFQSVPKLVLSHFGAGGWDWILRWLVKEFKVSQSWCWLVAGAQEVPVLFLLVGGA